MNQDQRQILKTITQLSETVQRLGQALDAEEPQDIQRHLMNAHSLASVAVEEIDRLIALLIQSQPQPLTSEEFRERLANRDRDASYKAFKKSSRRLRGISDE